MEWQNNRRSSNVEDRRGGGALVGGGIGLGGLIIVLIGWAFGIDPGTMLGFVEGSGIGQSQSRTGSGKDDEAKRFLSTILASTEDVWQPIFRQYGKSYREPTLVMFEGQVQSACGISSSKTGPFYCSTDQKLYIDPAFYQDMKKMGASGEFAFAYVVAHEVGHHVQKLLGTLDQAHTQMRRSNKATANQISVRIELQADCYAGIWGNKLEKYSKIRINEPVVRNGLKAAEAVGDDTLMQRAGQRVNPANFTHGSSADRMKWLNTGLQYGEISRCNTFN
ncbi:KPN_02809 family neutral zinc metallopeptidase [Cardiobacterium valvarum]|uniref:Putative neutral zinc metallopeptidase n=1 Tax=Cardiobacterium valvarum F0432 TaxID=797473 RepID=G9ZE90_9GAMM|nr:neutral zinc metallopeptidase [Cardiobacterium valvarum]EHM54849.1 putative neutral zinc metallopeptidase [Cardiobacterium valvarum F0432]